MTREKPYERPRSLSSTCISVDLGSHHGPIETETVPHFKGNKIRKKQINKSQPLFFPKKVLYRRKENI